MLVIHCKEISCFFRSILVSPVSGAPKLLAGYSRGPSFETGLFGSAENGGEIALSIRNVCGSYSILLLWSSKARSLGCVIVLPCIGFGSFWTC